MCYISECVGVYQSDALMTAGLGYFTQVSTEFYPSRTSNEVEEAGDSKTCHDSESPAKGAAAERTSLQLPGAWRETN